MSNTRTPFTGSDDTQHGAPDGADGTVTEVAEMAKPDGETT